MKTIVLGTQSPRRIEILNYYALPFITAASSFDESSVPYTHDPVNFVETVAAGKARNLEDRFHKHMILTADTIVYYENKIYGKPKSRHEAFEFISELQGQIHIVYTGVCCLANNSLFCSVEETKVEFNTLTKNEINHYLDSVDWKDKAGAYAIQKAGGLVVKRIDGCFYNVMGLPINTVRTLLKQIGIDLWNYVTEKA